MSATVDWVPQLSGERGIPADPVYDRATETASMRDLRQDVAPNGGVISTVICENDNASIGHFVDVIAYGAGRIRRGPVLDSECATDQPESGIQWGDSITLADNTQPIEGITDRCRIQRRHAIYRFIRFCF
jgi:hypothetical protein